VILALLLGCALRRQELASLDEIFRRYLAQENYLTTEHLSLTFLS
jgi:hypothetical protein